MTKLDTKKLIPLAEKGNRKAQCSLADFYSRKKQNKNSNYWFEKITKNSKAFPYEKSWALYSLGLSCEKGWGVSKSPKKAIQYYKRAGNHDSALLNLGICYGQGRGVKQDFKKAVEFYKKAAKLGNKNAAYNLALYYSKGRGVQKSEKLSKKWNSIYRKLRPNK